MRILKDKKKFLESEIKRADDFLNKDEKSSKNSFVIQFKKEKIEELKELKELNDANCETGEGKTHGLQCSENFMEVKEKNFEAIDKRCCGNNTLYQLSGWDKEDWLCADCFIRELINNNYQIKPQKI